VTAVVEPTTEDLEAMVDAIYAGPTIEDLEDLVAEALTTLHGVEHEHACGMALTVVAVFRRHATPAVLLKVRNGSS
jgi:hypothetical protein